MDTSSLKSLVEEWVRSNPTPRHSIVIRISANQEVEVKDYPLSTIKKMLNELYRQEVVTTHLYTTIVETLHEEFKKKDIDYGIATPQDFLRIFPSRKSFTKIRTIGEKAVVVMHIILKESGLDWPDM